MAEGLFTILMRILIITTVSAIENINDTVQNNFKAGQLIDDSPNRLLDAPLAKSSTNSQSSTSLPMNEFFHQLSYPLSRSKREKRRFSLSRNSNFFRRNENSWESRSKDKSNSDKESQKQDKRMKELETEIRKVEQDKHKLNERIKKHGPSKSNEKEEKTLDSKLKRLLEEKNKLERGKTVSAVDDRCLTNPCKNGGTCKQQPNESSKFVCICHVANRGNYCQDKTQICSALKCGRIKDCVFSPSGTHCICEGIPPNNDQSCMSDKKPQSKIGTGCSNLGTSEQNNGLHRPVVDQSQTVESNKKKSTTKQLIVGILVVIVILVSATCCLCIKANNKQRALEKLYVEALDQDYMPPEEPPEMSGVCMDVVKTTCCCAKSSYPDSYLPLNPQ
ncbi:uncharacterized protein LOC127859447 isoform X2 [Dreissena polymorpha]|uniref:uncharacterized protein LOC127859447 isoform X2 n=1 Tax=Dreissena polymorpha TaxID=45954 RepID=UPI002264BC70|nr:uncharacterized protein LOC127859447 isoform X2 [Dreissena polymorpha]